VNLLKETLRLYSLVPVVTRVAEADDTLGDQFIPKGTKIFICIKVHSDTCIVVLFDECLCVAARPGLSAVTDSFGL